MGVIAELASADKELRRSPADRGAGRRLWREAFGTAKEDATPHRVLDPNANRSVASTANATKRLLQALRSMAPGGWSDDRWEQTLRHYKGVPYTAIHRQNELLSLAEFQVYIEDPEHPDGKRPVTPDDPPQGERLVRPYDLVRLLKNPNEDDSFGDVLAQWNLQLDLTGMALTWMVPNELGTPMQLFPIPTAIAIPQPAINPDFPDGFYRIQPVYPYGPFSTYPSPASAVGAPIDARWMMRIKYPHPLLRYDGYSPQTAMNFHIDELEMMDRSRHSSMRRGINPSAVLNLEGMEGMDQIPEAEYERVRAEFENVLQGPDNAGNLFVATPGGKLEPWGGRPVDMDYQAGWDQLVSFVLGAGFGVTKPAAGMIEDSSYSTLFATLKQLYWLTLDPKVNRIGQKITRRIGPYFGDNLIVEVRCKRIDDHEITFQKADKIAGWKGLPEPVIRFLMRLLDLPVEDDVITELAKAQEGQGQPGMPGMPGQTPDMVNENDPGMQPANADQDAANADMQPAAGVERQAEEEKRRVEQERPRPGNLSRGALGPRKVLPSRFIKRKSVSMYDLAVKAMRNGNGHH